MPRLVKVRAGFLIEWAYVKDLESWHICHPMGPYFTAKRDAIAHMDQMPPIPGLVYRVRPATSKARPRK